MSARLLRIAGWLACAGLGLLGAGCTAAPIDVARSTTDFANGLEAYWSFDDISGTVLPDDSHSFRTGTIVNATATTGMFGGALRFQDGQEVKVDMFPPATPSWTVSAWARVDASQPGLADFVTLVSTEIPLNPAVAAGVAPGGWEMNIAAAAVGTTDPMRFHFGYFIGPAAGDYAFVECACVEPNVWTHVAAVVDAAKMTMSLYVNGVLKPPVVTTQQTIAAGSQTLYMANWYDAQTDPTAVRYLTGALDDVAIWTRALAPNEIALLSTMPVIPR